jgi:polyisoprenyl-teichoic acid--peptidoglycan teichoic acid transferase
MRVIRTVALAAVVAIVAVAVSVGFYLRAGATVFRVVKTASASQQWTPDKPLFVLLIGDDLRPGAGCGCSDAIHLVGVPAGGGSAVMLDIPRDTRVNIAGRGVRKINEAFRDGPQAAADTVGALVGVTVDYVISVGFDEFPQMIDDIGGVTVDVDMPMADRNSGAFFSPGPNDMNGTQAMAFARARHLGRGDFTRTEHQGQLILAVLAKFRAQGTSTVDAMKYLGVMMRYTRTEGIGTADLLRLGRLALSVDAASVRNVVMPGAGATIAGVSYVVTSADAPGLFADMADDAVLESH